MAKVAIISNPKLEQSQGAPGKSLQVDTEDHGIDNAEMYQLPGFYNLPHNGIQVVILDCNDNNIAVAAHDYNFNETIEQGETLIYSYDSDGVIKGKILIDKDGKFKFQNDTQDLKSLIDSLIDAIKNIITTGSPTTHTISPASQTALDGIKSDFADLLKV